MILELKKAFKRIETKIVITLCLVFSFLCLIDSILIADPCFSLSAFQASMAYDGKIADFFSTILLPIIAVLPFADNYYREKKYGVSICCLTRTSRSRYFLSKALAVFITSFIVILIPYTLNQLYCMIAFPMESSRNIVFGTMYDKTFLFETRSTPSPGILMNAPFLRNLLHILFACFYGGGIALTGFSLSLFIQKSRVITNILPIVLCFVWTIISLKLLGNDYVPALGIRMELNQHIHSYIPMIIVVTAAYIGCLLSIFIKCKRDLV